MSMMPTSFFKIGRDELPDDVSPKYKIGELVKVTQGNPDTAYGFYLDSGIGVVADISYFKTHGFKAYSPQVFYMIEYKIKWMEKDEFGFVLEHSIEPMEIK